MVDRDPSQGSLATTTQVCEQRYVPGPGWHVPGSGWGALLTGPAADFGQLGVGIGSGGNGAIVYLLGRGASTVSFVIYEAAGRVLSTPSAVNSQPGAYYPSIGFDPSQPDQGVTTWQQASNSSEEEIWVARLGL